MNKISALLAALLSTLAMHSFAKDCPVMSGEYIIGSSDEAEYSSISEAFGAVQCGGINGPVTFLVEDGTYPERLVLGKVEGTSEFNTIRVAAVSGERANVVISSPPSDATMILAGSSYITFEHLTFDNMACTFGNCVRADGDVHHVIFNDIVFNGVEGPRTGVLNAVVNFTSASSKSDISFENCEINNGSFGICKGDAKNEKPDSKTSITNTTFFNQQEGGIALNNEAAPVIASNIINTVSTNGAFTGISLNKVSGNIIVNKNVVNVANGRTGLLMNDCIADEGKRGQVINNTVGIGSSDEACGILISGATDYQVIDFNTIKLAVNESNASAQAFCRNTSSGKQVSMMNSTFYNLNTGGFIVYTDSYTNSTSESTPRLSASAK